MKRPTGDTLLGIAAGVLIFSGLALGGVVIVLLVLKLVGGVR
jgi:hypothetical protein